MEDPAGIMPFWHNKRVCQVEARVTATRRFDPIVGIDLLAGGVLG